MNVRRGLSGGTTGALTPPRTRAAEGVRSVDETALLADAQALKAATSGKQWDRAYDVAVAMRALIIKGADTLSQSTVAKLGETFASAAEDAREAKKWHLLDYLLALLVVPAILKYFQNKKIDKALTAIESAKDAMTSVPPEQIPRADWNFFVYLDGDNNLEEFAKRDLNEMEAVGSIQGKMNVIALVDGMEDDPTIGWTGKTRLMLIERDANNSDHVVSKPIAVDPQSDLGKLLAKRGGELNMGDPAVLSAALKYVEEKIPSNHTLLDMWNHGGAWRGIAWDDTDGDHIDIANGELGKALAGHKLDVISFDACLMANEEAALVAQATGADVWVASEETEPGTGWDYTDLLRRAERAVNSGQELTSEGLGDMIRESYVASSGNSTMSTVALANLPKLQASFNTFGDALIAAGGLGNGKIAACYNAMPRFADNDEIDLGLFAQRLAAEFPGTPIAQAAATLVADIRASIEAASDGSFDYKDCMGLTVYGPKYGVDSEYLSGSAPWLGQSWTKFIARSARTPESRRAPVVHRPIRPPALRQVRQVTTAAVN